MFHDLEHTSSLHSSLELPNCLRLSLELQSSLDPRLETLSFLHRNREQPTTLSRNLERQSFLSRVVKKNTNFGNWNQLEWFPMVSDMLSSMVHGRNHFQALLGVAKIIRDF